MSNAHVNAEGITPNAKRLLWAGFMAILAAGIGFAIRGGILDNWAADSASPARSSAPSAAPGSPASASASSSAASSRTRSATASWSSRRSCSTCCRPSSRSRRPRDRRRRRRTCSLLGHVHLRARERHARSGRQPARRDAVPEQPHALPEHPARELAGRPGARRPGRLDSRRRHAGELEDAARAVPGPDRPLRHHVLRPDVSRSPRRPQRAQRRPDVEGRRHSRRAVACCLSASSSGISWAASSASSPATRSLLRRRGAASPGRSPLVLLLIVGIKTQFSIGSLLLFVLFITHALVGAVELGTDGWIQNITGNILTPAQGKILFVFTSLLMFSLRFCAALHREEPEGLADRPAVHLRDARRRRPAAGQRHRDVRRRDARAGGLRGRQDVLLADDAGGRRRPLPAHRRHRHVASWAASA